MGNSLIRARDLIGGRRNCARNGAKKEGQGIPGPLSELEPLVALLAEPKKLVLVDAEDHFFAGGLDVLEREIAGLD